jgi:subtilisin family serine protease
MSRSCPSGAILIALFALAACSESPVQSIAISASPALAIAIQRVPEQVVGGDVIVAFRRGVDGDAVLQAHGLVRGQAGYRGAFVVARGLIGSEHASARSLRADPRVEWAEPNYLRTAEAVDPRLWAFSNPGNLEIRFTRGRNRGAVVASLLSVPDADMDNIDDGFAAGGASVVIGSIDTGVELSHAEFSGRVIVGHDWYGNDSDPSDENGHGTHTSGTMAGSTVGVAGVSGAAANVRIHVQRVCGQRGCPTAAIASAIRAAADVPGMVAMNLSLAGSTESQAEKDAIAYATGKNVLVIAAAGNGGTGTVACPACDPNAISVGATSWRDVHAYYTQWGPGLDLVAPGGELYSNTTSEAGILSAYSGGGYAYLQGTSMATPQVTGTAAIVASKRGLRGAALRAQLESTTDDLGTSGYDTDFGHGRVNSYRAVTGRTLPGGQ